MGGPGSGRRKGGGKKVSKKAKTIILNKSGMGTTVHNYIKGDQVKFLRSIMKKSK